MKKHFVPILASTLVLLTAAPSMAAIRPGDSVFIKVWNHPELSKQVTVDADGAVRVPLSGAVMIGGLDENAAEKKLADSLRPVVPFPAVSVEMVEQGKNLFVSGGPGGVLRYQPGETLSVAIADLMQSGQANAQALNAEGQSTTRSDSANMALRSRLDLHHVAVRRDGQTLGNFDETGFGPLGSTDPLLQPGDTIVFANKPIQVRVMGDVAQPGMTYLSADQSISEAVTQAGGALPTSASNHILLNRNGSVQSLAFGDPIFSGPAQPGDVITVPAAPRINVVGTVANPGVVALKTDSTLLSAIYTAGGPTKAANLKAVQVVHGTTRTSYNITALTHGDISQNPALQDGDTVVVPQGSGFDWSGVFGVLGGIAAGLATRVPF